MDLVDNDALHLAIIVLSGGSIAFGAVGIPNLLRRHQELEQFGDFWKFCQEWLPKLGAAGLGIGYSLRASKTKRKNERKTSDDSNWLALGACTILATILMLSLIYFKMIRKKK